MQGLLAPSRQLMIPGRDFITDPAHFDPSGLPRNGLVLLADPYRDAYGLDATARAALQTGTDYSGRGNTLTYGATTNASTDDPTNTGTAWTFGGDDFLGTPDLGKGDITAYTVFKTVASPVGTTIALFARDNFFVSTGKLFFRDTGDASRSVTLTFGSNATWYLRVTRFSSTGLVAVSDTAVGSLSASGYTPSTTSTAYGKYVGRATSFYHEGEIAFHAVYNWVHPDNLAMRCRNSIKSLMAPRGIAL